ncbi:LysR family transcriptional regulator [Cuneatibacter sp. NSJ-177]|uniref:LysR family transcriptional regulator n=1 Tax=Cuneatibacter sp. NSJ-177 TaxID=2931401 RepID=UPI001FD6196B|nr:LysR family transcriptional regulator [Cuneatibacter sp. NSJ-177]MCJ7835505.1 LysR family transcriptional regulator [Cuneatibacter sp. NSJ-177]
MTIRYLRIFISVVDYQTMNAASKALHISQPSISQAIAEMEDYYEVKLFDRLSKRLYLTDNGRRLLPYARYIVSTFDSMELEMKNSSARPTVRLGATIVFSTCFLPEIAKRLRDGPMQIQPDITVVNTKAVEEMLLNSELDIGVVEGSTSDPNIIRTHLLTDQLCLICSKNHKFYGQSISMEDLQGESVISREDFSYLRNYLHELAQKFRVTYRETWRCSGNEAILSAVRSGHGVTLVSSILVANELKSGEFYSIPIKDVHMTREFFLVYHKNKFIYPALQETIRTCTEYVQEVIEQEQSSSHFILP